MSDDCHLQLLIKFMDGTEARYSMPSFAQLNSHWHNVEQKPIESVSVVAVRDGYADPARRL
jgi:hypothetical protein